MLSSCLKCKKKQKKKNKTKSINRVVSNASNGRSTMC